MNLDFCRKASQYGTIGEEPTNRESCERPFCYRWGEVRLTECSTTCGPGIRSATVPCERITLDLVSKSTERNQISNTHVYRVEQTVPEECHSNLGYSPRIFLAENNQTIHVETAERPFGEQRGTELTQMFANNVVQLPCTNKPCAVSIPVWHTTSWDECSVTCGGGVRRRQVLCMLETHHRTTDETKGRTDYHLRQNTNVVVADQIKAEVADPQRCHDAGLPRPSDTETCNASPCPEWMADNWGPCDGICEYGVQHRHVRCVLDAYTSPPASTNPSVERSHTLLFAGSHGSYSTRTHRSVQQFREVNSELCEAVSAKPSTKRLCLITSGCPFWFYGEWSPCSVHCGVGQRVRKVDCRFPNGTLVHDSQSSWSKRNGKHTVHHGVTLDSIIQFVETNSKIPSCLAPPPVEEMSCKTRPCTGSQPFWWPVMVSECDSRTCDIGRRSRVVKCLSSSHGQLSESSCQHITHPTTWTPCVPFKCMKFHWSADPWSSCPRGCGIRTRYRRVRCVDPFGEEYSDSLCQAHLKPKNWDLCPDRCMSVPRSCSEIRKLHTNPKDGTFQIFIGIVPTSIFCADMDTSNPKEYVVLQRVNYARTGAFMSPSASSPWCPSASNTNSLSSSRNLHLPAEVPITIDTTNLTEFEGVFHRKVTTANCPNCDYLPHLSSVTYYQKIRLDVRALKVDVEDTRFAYTIGPTSVPYATAKDCFGSSSCPQGEFQIDLRGTGLRVSVKTHWAQSSPDSVSHIHRSEKGQLVTGHCGGYCSGCWPRPDLILDVVDDMSR
ncbi:unnamed protein product [Dicrocoelium dendriticum]|nr:unnamed protein product [Dicrocoelium dendriticum]